MTYCVIDINALKHNFKVLKANTASKICAVIKADAYGHGLIQTVRALAEADCFGVARANEAIALRDANINNDILLMGSFDDKATLKELIDNNIILTIHCYDELKLLTQLAKKHNGIIKTHLKIDSGMNRLGISDKETLDKIFNHISQIGNIKCDGIYTHYATSDSDVSYLEEQYNKFCKLTKTYKIKKHSANSAAVFQGKKYHMDMVRAGIMLYGYIDKNLKTYDGQKVCDIIKPAMGVYADIVQIKSLDADSYIGYDKAYKTQRPFKIAIISIGYGDGYPRLVNTGHVIIKNKRCNILGKVCMDLMAVDITDVKNVSYKDKAEIFGKNLGADVVAEWNKTISYDILCSVTKRVKKIWI